ncbi:MAG TPA: M50 family metallopeptidase [Trueperaceae bacterium]
MLTAVVFLLILTISVLVHEFTHFLNAKSVGLNVRAFSVGIGPVLLRRKWRGTEWRLSALPLGGYVDLPGMAAEVDEHGKASHPQTGFATKNLWQKLWVLVGGVLANFLVAILLVAIVVTAEPLARYDIGAAPAEIATEIVQVSQGSAADRLGIMPGDRIVALNGVANPAPTDLQRVIGAGGPLDLTIARGGRTFHVETNWDASPDASGAPPVFGISMVPAILEAPPAVGFPRAVVEATSFFVRVVPQAVTGLAQGVGDILAGRQSDTLAGPVGIVEMTHRATQNGFLSVLFFAAVINFSLAVFNLLPIPGLDGGRILLAVIIALRGKPLAAGQEEFIHFLGFMAVMALFALITFSELGGLFR